MITQNVVGLKFGNWEVQEILPNNKWVCKCSCGVIKEHNELDLVKIKTNVCRHKSNDTNKQFNNWTIIRELGQGKVMCKCECGTVKELYKKAVKNGSTKSCGCMPSYEDFTNKTFGLWHVDSYAGNSTWKCTCECGTQRVIARTSLIKNISRSCGCNQGNNLNSTLKYRYSETCTAKIDKPREEWQIDVVSSKEKFEDYLKSMRIRTIQELSQLLKLNNSSILLKIHRFGLENLVDINPMQSSYEKKLVKFIQDNITNKIIQNNRSIIAPLELDIYLPELNIAIEFNGNYWHSEIYKDRNYHINKTLICKQKGIKLIHIFEYEWEMHKDKIKQYLLNTLTNTNNNKIYARNTVIKEVTNSTEEKNFLNTNHLQGYAPSSIAVGLYHEDKLVSIITLGVPRFNKRYEYEIIRICSNSNNRIVGGTERLFKYIINKYKCKSIISYCNLSKFFGEVYTRLGFTEDNLTKPNYVWINGDKVLNRYETQKHKLIQLGLGDDTQSEDSIMHNQGYVKVYDCGNARFIWSSDN